MVRWWRSTWFGWPRGGPLRVVLFEKRERFAQGAAYSTTCPQHLLNVPAGMMSALVDEPDHFLSWLQARDPEAHRGTFAPRRSTARISKGCCETPRTPLGRRSNSSAMRSSTSSRRGQDRACGSPDATAVACADQVVLALGNPTPQDPIPGPSRAQGLENYLSNPWEDGALDGLGEEDSVLLIGSGLTAVDLIVGARAKGHKGPMIVVSRHGLLPFPHAQVPPRPHGLAADGAARTVRSLLRHVRQEASRYASEGGDWRSIIDSLRPVTQTIWHSFDEGEKTRFVRHLSSRWDVHRHRIAPEVARIVDEARRDGQLTVIAGRVLALDERSDRVAVTLRPRGKSDVATVLAHRVINCTGPSRDIRIGHSPLVTSLMERGFCRPGPLSLGLEVSEVGALVASNGAPSDRLYALGPLLRGRLWETTAVRELRAQAFDLARHLVDSGPGVGSPRPPRPLSARLSACAPKLVYLCRPS